jgi:hypothetical protein
MMHVDLSVEDLQRIIAALDSHVYWQLSDRHYRHNGDVCEPGSDDPKQIAEIEACRALADKLDGSQVAR